MRSLRWPLLAAGAFVLLMALAVGGWGPLAAFDASVADAFRSFGAAHPTLIAVVRVATDVAATLPFFLLGALVALFLAVRAERRAATFVAVTCTAAATLWSLMHLALPHTRPENAFVTVTSNGFPSGHTTNATALALILVTLLPARRPALIPPAVLFAASIGLSRLILLAHYPSQVLAGWLLALAVVPAIAHWLLRPTPPKPAVPHPTNTQTTP
jgi:membrane-associated phospholipid phosphatase